MSGVAGVAVYWTPGCTNIAKALQDGNLNYPIEQFWNTQQSHEEKQTFGPIEVILIGDKLWN